jgi:uncharacterized caspase-like protein
MSGKYALIIGNTEYTDPGLAQLSAPGKDAEDFARVLNDPEIGAFDKVNILLNQSSSAVSEAMDEFFDQKKPDDLLVLYFSGHGVRDELGALYLAVKNTIRTRLRSTAIKSDYIREAMDQSRSKRQVLILDCCNSGAFAQGTKAATGVSIGIASAFESGYGRIILTASDSTQFAWEGDKVIGETDNSLFTHYLVKGLDGEADLDGDGRITVDELYDYAYEKVRLATPKQTPSKFSSKQQGEIVLRQSTRIENIKPQPLPDELIGEIEDTRPYVREAAVQKLEKILKGKNIGLARSALEALEKIATDENTTRRVAQAVAQVLESFYLTEQKANDEKVQRSAIQIKKAEDEGLAAEKAEVKRKAKEGAERLALKKAEEERSACEKLGQIAASDDNSTAVVSAKQILDEAGPSVWNGPPAPKPVKDANTEQERLIRERAEAVRLARERERKQLAQTRSIPAFLPPIPIGGIVSPQQGSNAINAGKLATQKNQPNYIRWIMLGGGAILCMALGTIGLMVGKLLTAPQPTKTVPVVTALLTSTNTVIPTGTIPPATDTNVPPAATMTHTPTSIPLTHTFTPAPTITDMAPDDPSEFIIFYFDTVVGQKDFQKGWSLLTPAYQVGKSGGWDKYIEFWSTVKSWSRSSIQTEYRDSLRARVLITYRLYYYNNGSDPVDGVRYCLLWQASIRAWQIDLRENCP